ncbi:MAG: poly(R)-hydroxyalkanoic acid synthase subunit PhaE [Bacillota bacterium]|nr:poly(R)-hydroxyalkanoic acid synthase subunit PhaE [Bacillota bacterium]
MSEDKSYMGHMEMYFENQKKMFDYWKDIWTIVTTTKDSEDEKNINEDNSNSISEITKQWTEFYNPFAKNFTKFFFPLDTFNKMFTGINVYQNLNKFWEDLVKNITGKESDTFDFCKKWNAEYPKLTSFYLPNQWQSFYNNFLENYQLATDTSQKFLNPWLGGFQSIQTLLAKSITGDKSAYIELIELWNDKFFSTFGKIFNIPQFSMNRELTQKQMHSLNAYINFFVTMTKFLSTMTKVSQETLEKIIKEYQGMLIKGTNPKSFKEFYEYWWKQNEAAYQTLFGTDEFCKLIAHVMDAGVNFKKEYDGLLENMLKYLPYPSRRDMDSVYKTLDDLKREVRTLKKEVNQSKELSGK